MRWFAIGVGGVLLSSCAAAPSPAHIQFPSSDGIQTMLEEMVREGRTVGIVVGLLDWTAAGP